MAENYSKHDEVAELFIEKLNTLELDNELVLNNRKIAKLLQGVIVAKRNDINLTNIKSVSGTLKDIESIANPQTNKEGIIINNQNLQQNNEVTREIVEETLKTFDDEY